MQKFIFIYIYISTNNISRKSRVHLISIDRPGFGNSDYYPHHSITRFAEDVRELLDDHLHIPQDRTISLFGWSGKIAII